MGVKETIRTQRVRNLDYFARLTPRKRVTLIFLKVDTAVH